jgi:polysaccharide export outer membrane protein
MNGPGSCIGIVWALGCLGLATPVSAQALQNEGARQAAADCADYVIGVEDVLSVFVWKEPDLSKNVNVRPDGKISFPLVGDLQASGKTPRELAATLTEALSKFIREPIVTVTVEPQSPHDRQIGTLTLKRRTRLLQAIAMAGGLSPCTSKIIVVRDDGGREVRTEIAYRNVISGERPELNIYLKPGDTIIVQ